MVSEEGAIEDGLATNSAAHSILIDELKHNGAAVIGSWLYGSEIVGEIVRGWNMAVFGKNSSQLPGKVSRTGIFSSDVDGMTGGSAGRSS